MIRWFATMRAGARLIASVVIGAVSVVPLLYVHLFFGMVTGVVAMCASAPRWWIDAYPYTTIWVIPASLWIAIRVHRRLVRRSRTA